MSYEFYLAARNRKAGAEKIRAFWEGLEWFKGEGDNLYENLDTGVHFTVSFDDEKGSSPGSIELSEDEQFVYDCAISLNYLRPSFFGRELAWLIEALEKKVPLRIYDPQISEEPLDTFDRDAFGQAWAEGHITACAATKIQERMGTSYWSVPNQELVRTWDWNFTLRAVRAEYGEDIFLPRINFAILKDQVLSFCIWPDGIPALIPRVDAILVSRDQFCRGKVFGNEPDVGFSRWGGYGPCA